MHNYTLPQETNVAQAKSLLANSHYIDDDLLILDEINVNSISENALRMQCLFMALCTEGHARYCVDTKEQEVEAGDVMIVSEGQVLSNYMLSPDCRGVALMMSYDFIMTSSTRYMSCRPCFFSRACIPSSNSTRTRCTTC